MNLHGSKERGRAVGALWVTAAAAAVAAMARSADGGALVPLWAVILLQAPAPGVWLFMRCRRRPNGARNPCRRADVLLLGSVLVGGASIGFARGDVAAAFLASTLFVCGALAVEAGASLYHRLETCLDQPLGVLRVVIGPWIGLILVATALLAAPLATNAAVPDYRHNFTAHVVHSAFAATSAACLNGVTVYHPGEDYTFFGQVVLWLTTQIAGMGFAAVGLSLVRPFLQNAIRLRSVLLAAFGLQLLTIALTAFAWSPSDAPTLAARIWWSCVHAADAIWNSGFMLRGNGLAGYHTSGWVFASLTSTAIIGSLGLPIIVDILKGKPTTADKAGQLAHCGSQRSPGGAASPWKRLPQWEAGAAFVLLMGGAIALWAFEMPGLPPGESAWTRPVDYGHAQVALRDDGARWPLAVFTSASLRSAGMQSIPVSRGGVSRPSYVLMLVWMILGGSIAGTAGGMRITAVLLLMIAVFYGRRWGPDGERSATRSITRAIALYIPAWLLLNAVCVGLFALTTDASLYESVFEPIAAFNGVGFSTGRSVHLTKLGGFVMIVFMMTGRLIPLFFWSSLTRGLAGGAGPRAGETARSG